MPRARLEMNAQHCAIRHSNLLKPQDLLKKSRYSPYQVMRSQWTGAQVEFLHLL